MRWFLLAGENHRSVCVKRVVEGGSWWLMELRFPSCFIYRGQLGQALGQPNSGPAVLSSKGVMLAVRRCSQAMLPGMAGWRAITSCCRAGLAAMPCCQVVSSNGRQVVLWCYSCPPMDPISSDTFNSFHITGASNNICKMNFTTC